VANEKQKIIDFIHQAPDDQIEILSHLISSNKYVVLAMQGKETNLFSNQLKAEDCLHIAFSLFSYFDTQFGQALVTPILASLIVAFSSITEINKAEVQLIADIKEGK
jgi:hypothetical protein